VEPGAGLVRTRRVVALAVAFAALVLALVARLVQLQWIEHEDWQREAWRARLSGGEIPYRRGRLLDRAGRVLADDRISYELVWHYRDFRRGHPSAQFLEACALLGRDAIGLAESFARAEASAAIWLACRPQDLAAMSARDREDLGFYLRRLAGVRSAESAAFTAWAAAREGAPLGEAFPWAAARHSEALQRARADWRRLAHALGEDEAVLMARLEEQRRALQSEAEFRALRQAAARATELDVGGVLAALRGTEDAPESGAGLAARLHARWRPPLDAGGLARLLLERAPPEAVLPALAAAARAAPADVAGLVRAQRFALHADRALVLRRDLDFPAVDLLVQEAAAFPGFSVREVPRREYPEAGAAHLVGLVRVPNEQELAGWSAQREEYGELARVFERNAEQEARYRTLQRALAREAPRRGELIGSFGAEAAFDARLRGHHGLLRALRGADDDAQPLEVEFVPAQDGQDVRLTLDVEWNRRAAAAFARAYAEALADPDPAWSAEVREGLRHPRGGFALLDLRDGATPVLATLPGYEAGDYRSSYGTLRDDPDAPLRQRALGSLYRVQETPYPGSTFKPLIAAAALMRDPGAAQHRIVCEGSWRPRRGLPAGLAPLACDERRSHGSVDMEEALMRSCNVYFYGLAEELGYEPMHALAATLGFGAPTGFEVGPSGQFLMPPAEAKHVYTVARLSIGQVAVAASPLQMARSYGWLASGVLWRPRLAAGDAPMRDEAPALDPAARALIAAGLRGVVEDVRGTAHDARWPLAKFHVAGKTGTAQAAGGAPVHAWFTGWFPHERPRYAFAILCENAGVHGGDLAAVALYRFLEENWEALMQEDA
jgi:cell division protein FtsI/penicillin-binding protein 2